MAKKAVLSDKYTTNWSSISTPQPIMILSFSNSRRPPDDLRYSQLPHTLRISFPWLQFDTWHTSPNVLSHVFLSKIGIPYKIWCDPCVNWHLGCSKHFQLKLVHIGTWGTVKLFLWHVSILKSELLNKFLSCTSQDSHVAYCTNFANTHYEDMIFSEYILITVNLGTIAHTCKETQQYLYSTVLFYPINVCTAVASRYCSAHMENMCI